MENDILADVLPTGACVLEADGIMKMQHVDFTQALKAGFELKQKFPHMQVKVYETNERVRRSAD